MAISVNWGTGVIFVPKADLTLVSGSVYELDVNTFRLSLKALEDDPAGMPYPKTHRHNTEVLLSGVTYSRTVEILAPYTVEFEDGTYSVSCVNANHNIADVRVVNSVSLIVNNSAGLIQTNVNSVLRAVESRRGAHASYGKDLYLDPINGSDSNSGLAKTNAKKTWANGIEPALSTGDRVYLVASGTGVTTMTERIITTKDGFSLRAPGSSKFLLYAQASDPGDILSIGSDTDHSAGVSVSGMTIKSDAVSGNGIKMFGDENLFEDIIIDSVPDDGFSSADCSNITLSRVRIMSPGNDSVSIENCNFLTIDDCLLYQPGSGTAVNINSNINGDSKNTDIRDTVIQSASTAGVNIGAGSQNVKIRESVRFIDTPVQIIDNGTNTHNEYELKNAIRRGSFGEAVYLDVANVTGKAASGTKYPTGTGAKPANNLADAISIANTWGFPRLIILSDMTVDATDVVDNFILEGATAAAITVTVTAGGSSNKTVFRKVTLTGVLTGADMEYEECFFSSAGLSGLNGDAIRCQYKGAGPYVISNAANSRFHSVDGRTTATTSANRPDFQIGNCQSVAFRAQAGSLGISNMNDPLSFVCIDMISGGINLASSNTDGILVLRDGAPLTDNTAGTTVNSVGRGVAEQVWIDPKALSVSKYLALK